MTGRRLVVVGGSLAGLRAAEAARRLGFGERITLVGAEVHLPYDRPPLSKAFLTATELPDPIFRTSDRLAGQLQVELRLGAPATALDTVGQRLRVGAQWLAYDGLIIATGAHARTLELPAMAGVHVLRTRDDAAAVRTALEAGPRVVIIGAGFIGSEVASSARARGLSVTIVEATEIPLSRAVGAEVGHALAALHGRNGTDLRLGTTLARIVGENRVERVELSDGTTLPAEVVVVGVGASPATDWLADSGLRLEHGLLCDEYLHTGAEGVYAAGDVVRWPNPLFPQAEPMRLEHWTNAAEQSVHAVRNLLSPEDATPFQTVPYFWSDWYDSRIQFVGMPSHEEVRVVRGALNEPAFVALYRAGDRLVGALALNQPAAISKYRGLVARGCCWDEALDFAASQVSSTRLA